MVDSKAFDYSKVRDVLKGLGAQQGKVVTRFPPEPSGYLHIGHIKASMLNYHYAKMYGGKMILRFDDTNPTAEKIEFVENIMNDLKTLDIIPDRQTFSSDYFEEIQEYCRKLITDNNAYADDTPAEEMKIQRDAKQESKMCKENTVAQNLKHFEDMISGKVTGFCIRARLDMTDKVGCLRDPVFYRCKAEAHHRTGTKYKAYPTYDLTVPIVDSIEDVTHALRTIEYRDRNPLYAWVQKVLNLRPVKIYDFSKLCMASTVLSKRKLNWFVNEKLVEGWNDPRFPTVQGIMRKGMTVEALKEFMLEQGPSQNNNLMEWDKIWANNKKVIDPIAPRYTCISKETACKIIIENGPNPVAVRSQPLHPKNEAVGTKGVSYGCELWIERDDAKDIKEGEKITLMKWGNANVTKVTATGDYIEIRATINEADTDYKGTKKVTWLCADPNTTTEIELVEYAHLINKQKIEEGDKVEDLVNKDSRHKTIAYAEGAVRNLQKGAIIQYERRGFYIIDKLGLKNQVASYIFIPDGKAKAMSAITQQVDAAEMQKGKGAIKNDKKKPEQEEGKGPSKKDLAKAAKKASKDTAKQNAKDGIVTEAKPKGKPAAAKQAVAAVARPVQPKGASGDHVDQLEKDLQVKQWLGGDAPSQQDYLAFVSLNGECPSPASHPYTFGWYLFVSKFTDAIKKSWEPSAAAPAKKDAAPKGKKEEPKKVEVKKEEPKPAADDDDFDPFADEEEEDEEAEKAKMARMKEIAKTAKSYGKAPVIAKSIIIFEVKPWGEETDLDALAKMILAIEMDGLFWKTEYKKEPIAYGVFKIVIGCVVEDDKVSTDILQEAIEAFEDECQSVDIQSFNKL